MKRNKIEFRNWRIELNRKNMNREFQEQNLIKQKKESANLSHFKVSRVSIRGKKKKNNEKKVKKS